ncbi:MAG TPA: OsmC family protein [Gemmatimonadaceae bacterium]|nr:OsmC family protein [Gemmatimonadaceae bacterium]
MTNPPPSVRSYEVSAETTATFGRILASARDQHFVVDGPVQNGCPGEAPTPPEIFLGGVACCGAELIQVIARDEGIPVTRVAVRARGMVDRGNQPRSDVTIFSSVALDIAITGADGPRAAALVEGFKRR